MHWIDDDTNKWTRKIPFMILTSPCIFVSFGFAFHFPTDGLAFRPFFSSLSHPNGVRCFRKFCIRSPKVCNFVQVAPSFKQCWRDPTTWWKTRVAAEVLPFPVINLFYEPTGFFFSSWCTQPQSSTTLLGGQFTQQHICSTMLPALQTGQYRRSNCAKHKQKQNQKKSIGWQPI